MINMGNSSAVAFTSFSNEVFGEIRFIDVEGKPYAVGNDIALALGYARPRKAISDHCKGVLKKSYLTNGGKQDLNVIPEGDIYRLIMKSRLPQAEAFEKWVMDEVIPQIRATGGYIPVRQEYSDTEILSKAFAIAQRTISNYEEIVNNKDVKIKEQENIITEQTKVITEQTKVIEEQSKDVEYLYSVISPPKLITSTDVAKDLGITSTFLHKVLHLRGIIYKPAKGKCWKFYKPYQHMIPEFADYHINEFSQILKWTEKGRRFIIELLNNDKKTQEIVLELCKEKNKKKH